MHRDGRLRALLIALALSAGCNGVIARVGDAGPEVDASRGWDASRPTADAGPTTSDGGLDSGLELELDAGSDADAPRIDSGPLATDAGRDAGPPGDAGPVDEFDLGTVNWLYPDVSGWPITTTLRVTFSGNLICLEYDKKDVWPVVTTFGTTDVVANAWVIAEDGGQWHAGTFEWMRPGQACKFAAAVDGAHIKRSPFDEASGWTPQSGETLYFFVSGLVRNPNYRNVSERSNVVRVVWP